MTEFSASEFLVLNKALDAMSRSKRVDIKESILARRMADTLNKMPKGKIDPQDDPYEFCWTTGQYEDQNCEQCHHAHECSGYTGDSYE
jgi:hypothetical protein